MHLEDFGNIFAFTQTLKTVVQKKKDSQLVLIFENIYDGIFLELIWYKFSNVSSSSGLQSITIIYLFHFIEI